MNNNFLTFIIAGDQTLFESLNHLNARDVVIIQLVFWGSIWWVKMMNGLTKSGEIFKIPTFMLLLICKYTL